MKDNVIYHSALEFKIALSKFLKDLEKIEQYILVEGNEPVLITQFKLVKENASQSKSICNKIMESCKSNY